MEDFVCYLNSVEEVSAMIPSLERQLQIITHLYNVAQEFAVTVAEEQLALYKAIFPQLRYLKVGSDSLFPHSYICVIQMYELLR